ncbi:FYVE zinc finger [Sesbania bispinosa]|nr:FYVE zinc finger [Sesbania bispinosa]
MIKARERGGGIIQRVRTKESESAHTPSLKWRNKEGMRGGRVMNPSSQWWLKAPS